MHFTTRNRWELGRKSMICKTTHLRSFVFFLGKEHVVGRETFFFVWEVHNFTLMWRLDLKWELA